MRWLVRKASDSSPSPSSSSNTLVLILEFCKSIFLIITIIIIITILVHQSSGKMIMDNLHAMANRTAAAHHHHHHHHHHVRDPSYITRPLLVKDHDVANHNVRYKSSANRFLQFLQLHANLTKFPTNFHSTRKLLGIPTKQGNFTGPLSPSTQLVAASSLGPGPASQPISSSTRSTVLHTNTKRGKHHKPYNHGNMQHDNSSSSVNNIDPRYGVEKRLVPTGPNPLHN